jgi:VanZ family protein
MAWARFVVASLWALVVLTLGSAPVGAQQTGPFVVPLLNVLLPHASPDVLDAAHLLLRKLAHLTEYAVLALLWFKALGSVTVPTRRAAPWAALAICLACAFADELHQSTLPTRTGSTRDFLIDAVGATTMLVVAKGRQGTV